jgi:hypothetical protein
LRLSCLATCVHLVLTLALILTRTRQPLPAEQRSLQDSAMVPGYCDMIKPRTDSFISVHVTCSYQYTLYMFISVHTVQAPATHSTCGVHSCLLDCIAYTVQVIDVLVWWLLACLLACFWLAGRCCCAWLL